MKIPLSRRLMACAERIAPGDTVADVGCDHGYLGIYLLKQEIAQKVIAADIHKGPLRSAYFNAGKYGVSDRMSFCLSDGVKEIPRNFNTLVCAGMGADTMISILTDAPWLKDAKYRLVLQCQSKTPSLRRYLSENGWYIAEESALRDGRFLYTVMEAVWAPEQPRLTVGQWYIPPALQKSTHPEAAEYILRTLEGLRMELSHQENPEKKQALEELEITLSADKELS